MEQPTAPGKCIDCGNDAFIRLTSQNGSVEMICGHCYAERHPKRRVEQNATRAVRSGPKLPRRS